VVFIILQHHLFNHAIFHTGVSSIKEEVGVSAVGTEVPPIILLEGFAAFVTAGMVGPPKVFQASAAQGIDHGRGYGFTAADTVDVGGKDSLLKNFHCPAAHQ
jgi:hypothetical protein